MNGARALFFIALGLVLGVPLATWIEARVSYEVALQARVIGLSHRHAPQAPAVAAGLNIAGFNGGIALGSLLGGASLAVMGLTSTAWVGALAVGLGIVWLRWQMRRPAFLATRLQG